jgi:hypothetical protein
MAIWSAATVRRTPFTPRLAAVLTMTLAATLLATNAPAQVPAPYELFVHTDGELKTEYSAASSSTVVQLAIMPPGAGDTPSATSMVFRAEFLGRQPLTPPGQIGILVLPTPTSSPNVIRGVQLAFTIQAAGSPPVDLSYFGRSWGENGFVPPGGELRRVEFSMSVPELRALLLGRQVTGRVMNSTFAFTTRHLAALRLFAMAIGVPQPGETP